MNHDAPVRLTKSGLGKDVNVTCTLNEDFPICDKTKFRSLPFTPMMDPKVQSTATALPQMSSDGRTNACTVDGIAVFYVFECVFTFSIYRMRLHPESNQAARKTSMSHWRQNIFGPSQGKCQAE